jgi:relaxase-like protein
MIGRVLQRGSKVGKLLYYLYGPGKACEHVSPHLVLGWCHLAELEPPLRPGGGRDFRYLTGLLEQPLALLGDRAPDQPVWHCAVRAAPGDPDLGDDAWMRIAAEIMHRTGLSRYGEEDDGVRWVAVHHGYNHIHLVATLARQDGRRARLDNDYYRIGETLRAIEAEYGLVTVTRADRTAVRAATRAESEKAARAEQAEPPRVTLRRHVQAAAAAARSEPEFFAALEAAGLLVRVRPAPGRPGEAAGYAVSLPGLVHSRDGQQVWYGGQTLSSLLALGALGRRWRPGPPGGPAASLFTGAEAADIARHAARMASEAARQLKARPAPAKAADIAWAAADVLTAAADQTGCRCASGSSTARTLSMITSFARRLARRSSSRPR